MKMTLKAIRINNNWTIEETAKLYGVSVDTVYSYEKFKTYPDIPIINNILKASNMNYDDIIFLPQDYCLTVKKNQ